MFPEQVQTRGRHSHHVIDESASRKVFWLCASRQYMEGMPLNPASSRETFWPCCPGRLMVVLCLVSWNFMVVLCCPPGGVLLVSRWLWWSWSPYLRQHNYDKA